jgi:DNA-binding transcriptional MerR regulator
MVVNLLVRMDSNAIRYTESATIQLARQSTNDEGDVRISELSRRAGLPLATVKYYLREGLLRAGRSTAPNQAEYDESHVHRLRLIRTLRDVGGMEIDRIRRVLAAIDDEAQSRHDLFGAATLARETGRRPAATEAWRRAREEVDAFLDDLGWQVRPEAGARDELADALAGLRNLGRDLGAETFRPYAEAADRMAAWEVRSITPSGSRAVAVEQMVVGTVVFGAVFDALRRLAHEHHSATTDRASPAAAGERTSG